MIAGLVQHVLPLRETVSQSQFTMHLVQYVYTWTWTWLSDHHLALPMMRKTAVMLAAFQATSTIAAGQIPVVDSVIGGVPSSSAVAKSATQSLQFTPLATTSGKLRITAENSGVCGMLLVSFERLDIPKSPQRPPLVCSKPLGELYSSSMS